MRRIVVCVAALLLILAGVLTANPAEAGGASPVVSGVVSYPGGVPVNHAYVSLWDPVRSLGASMYTGADGVFSLSVVPGAYVLHFEYQNGGVTAGSSRSVTVVGDVVEDIVVPASAVVDFVVSDAMGNPVVGAFVDLVSERLVDGLWSYDGGGQKCSTDATGHCVVTSLLGATINATAKPPSALAIVVTATLAVSPTTVAFTVPASPVVSGVVSYPGGVPVNHAYVSLWDPVRSLGASMYTGADGVFSLSVVPGAYVLHFEYQNGGVTAGSSRSVTVVGDVVEDIVVPASAVVDFVVSDAMGNPVVGAFVDLVSERLVDGLWSYDGGGQKCSTDATGHCVVTSLLGATINATAKPPSALAIVVTATLAVSPTTVAFTVPASPVVSGVVSYPGGVPVNHAYVSLWDPVRSLGASMYTGADGVFSLSVVPGAYVLHFEYQNGGVTAGSSRSVTVVGDVVEDIVVPASAVVDFVVSDAMGNPVVGAFVDLVSERLVDGLWSYDGGGQKCSTDATGHCVVTSLLGATINATAKPPSALAVASSSTVVSDPTIVSIPILHIASVPSSGPVAGPVGLSVPVGAELSDVASVPVDVPLPSGFLSPTGLLTYQVLGLSPGSSIDVVISLPDGSAPTTIAKLIDGVYVDAASLATISADVVTMHLTDGGPGDEDGVANGVIVDPVVPMRPVPVVVPGAVSVVEGDVGVTVMSVPVTLSHASALPVSVSWSTFDYEAVAGSDFVAAAGTLTFAPGETSKSVAVSVVGDRVPEGDEYALVLFTNPVNARVGGFLGIGGGLVRNDDTVVVPGAVSVVEGDVGVTVMSVPVTLSHASALPVSVSWSTFDYEAVAGSDFVAAAGTVTFAPGETSKSVAVSVVGDRVPEGDEYALVLFTNPVNARVGGFLGIGGGLVRNDDTVVVPGAVSVVEGDVGVTVMSVPVTLSHASALPVTVSWSTFDYEAVAGSDFVAAAGTVTFAPGETSKSVAVSVVGDRVPEGDEYALVLFTNPVNARVGGFLGIGGGLVRNDDHAP